MLKNLMMMAMTIVLAIGVSGPASAAGEYSAEPTEQEIATLLTSGEFSDDELASEIEALVAGSSDPVVAAKLVLSVAQVFAPEKGSVIGTGLANAASGLTVIQKTSIATAVQSSNVPGVGTTYASASTGGSANGGGTETGSTDSTGNTSNPPRASTGTGTSAPTSPSNELTGSST
ncbi:MAG: hypothetical protein KUG61_07990 [Parvibaculaceae bacterium]|nr:hypothetical protein [Parvibaculaceae bacterium]